uniref:leucine-rich repeat protein n=1 Tax=uncultured Dysgonomonas sp. TaxID=206096 RepID=UPI00260FC0DE|nr:leucine-rich repeat domain-containing protein [uncultured Dysgonomonas sp.]
MTKKILALLFSVIIWVIPTYGQLSKNITVNTPGTLESQLGADKTKITDLVLTGTINSVDFTTIKQMTLLKILDMSNVNIIDGKIPASAFAYRDMTTLIFPVTLKTIGANAFRSASFAELDFKQCLELEEIGEEAFCNVKLIKNNELDFSGNTKLTRLLSPSGFGTFGEFSGHVILPRNMIEIPQYSFARFKGSVVFPPVLEIIRAWAFAGSQSSAKLVFPVTLKVIGTNVFRSASFAELDFKQCLELEEIGEEAFCNVKLIKNNELDFSGNTKLTRLLSPSGFGTFGEFSGHVILPRNMIEIPQYSFARFKGSVVFPPVLEIIRAWAFAGSQSSAKLVFPVTLKVIGTNVFRSASFAELDFKQCLELEEINSEAFCSVKLTESNILDFSDCVKLTRLLSLSGFGTFGDFSGHVILPGNMITIPKLSFFRFKGSITFSPVLEIIGESAFANSVFTKGIVFPNSLKTIGTKAFYNSTIPSVSFEQMDPSQSGVSCF